MEILIYMYKRKCLRTLFFGTCLMLFVCFPFYGVAAAEIPDETMAAESAGRKFVMDFIFTATGENGEIIYEESGSVAVNGGLYRMTVSDDLVVVGNEDSQWLYKPQSDEIIIVSSEISRKLAAASSMDELVTELISLFISESDSGHSRNHGHGLNSKNSFVRPEIVWDKGNRLSEIRIKTSDKAGYKIKITSFSEVKSLPDTLFIFDSSKYPYAIITDLRQ